MHKKISAVFCARCPYQGLDGDSLGGRHGLFGRVWGKVQLYSQPDPFEASCFSDVCISICHFMHPCLEVYLLIDLTHHPCAQRTRGIGEARSVQQLGYVERVFLCLRSLSVSFPVGITHRHLSVLPTADRHTGHALYMTEPRATSASLEEGVSRSRKYLNLQVSQSLLHNYHRLTRM